MAAYPVETTRFHPTFAYEMVWNFAAAGLLLYVSRRLREKLRPGAIFAGWLVLAGIGRFIIEFFRPDQPLVPGTPISYTRVVATLMALAGAVLLLIQYQVVRLPRLSPGPRKYVVAVTETEPAESEAAGP
jgi:phosphatidylglycerol:prolipoprotein diacylglycerol transferase